jgi:hypothetical protein
MPFRKVVIRNLHFASPVRVNILPFTLILPITSVFGKIETADFSTEDLSACNEDSGGFLEHAWNVW